MFGDGFFGQWRLKLMSAFTTGMVASTSMLTAGNPEVVVQEIKKELRSDGVSYSFEATESFDMMTSFSELLKAIPNGDSPEMKEGLKLWGMLLNDFGFNDIDGYGSSLAKEGKLYDLDAFMHLKPGNEKSLLWQLMGGNASELTTLKLIPEETILSVTFKLDLASLWKYVKTKAPEINIPQAGDIIQRIQMFEDLAAQNGTPVEEVVKALTTEATLFVTMNKDKEMMLPSAPPMPQMAATLILKKNGDFLQNYLSKMLTGAPVTNSEKGEFKVTVLNEVLPSGTKPGLASGKDHLIFTTDAAVFDKVIAAKSGKGLLASSAFSKFKSIGTEGNGAVYISSAVSNTISDVTSSLPSEVSMITTFYSSIFFQDKVPELFMVYGKRANGLKADMLSSFRMASSQLQTVAVIGVLAAMILPALGKARVKAKEAKSKSRLKQIGVTVAMYYTDGGQAIYPKNFDDFDFDEFILGNPSDGTPHTLKQTMEGQGAYLFLRKAGDTYTGGSNIPLAMEKPGLWNNGQVLVVFEDGHVESFFGNSVEEVLQAIKDSGL